MKRMWSPCEFHINQILKSGRTEATREELEKHVHPTCACLNLNNPDLYCTLHPGGAEELIRRREIKNGDDRSALWREQKAEVDKQLEAQRPSQLFVTEASEEVIEFECNQERVSVTVTTDGGGSCV
jgi:hypothetical protein